MSSRLPEVLQLLKYWAYDSMHVAFILLSILVLIHACFVHLMLSSPCTACIFQIWCSSYDSWRLRTVSAGVPTERKGNAEPLPRSNSISPHLTAFPGRATSRFMQAWRRLFCFGFRVSVNAVMWHPVASRGEPSPRSKAWFGRQKKGQTKQSLQMSKKTNSHYFATSHYISPQWDWHLMTLNLL